MQCAGVAATVTQPGEEYNRSSLCEAYRLAGIEEVGIFIGASRRGHSPGDNPYGLCRFKKE